MGNQDEAIAAWTSLTSDRDYLSPELAYYNIGLTYVKRAFELRDKQTSELAGTLSLAESSLLNALRISKYFIDALFYLAQVYIMQNRKEDARNALQQIVIEAPEHEAAKRILNGLEQEMQTSGRRADNPFHPTR